MKIFVKILICILLVANSYSRELSAAVFNIPPWAEELESGEIVGIQKEIIDALSKDIGVPIKIKIYPYKRMVSALMSGEVDFSIFYKNKGNDDFSDPLVKWGKLSIIVLPRKSIVVKDYKSLKGLNVGVRLGGKFDDRFDVDDSILKKNCLNYADCIKKLGQGRIDAVIGTAATIFYELKKQGYKKSSFGRPYFISNKEDWFHFSKSSQNLGLKKS